MAETTFEKRLGELSEDQLKKNIKGIEESLEASNDVDSLLKFDNTFPDYETKSKGELVTMIMEYYNSGSEEQKAAFEKKLTEGGRRRRQRRVRKSKKMRRRRGRRTVKK